MLSNALLNRVWLVIAVSELRSLRRNGWLSVVSRPTPHFPDISWHFCTATMGKRGQRQLGLHLEQATGRRLELPFLVRANDGVMEVLEMGEMG